MPWEAANWIEEHVPLNTREDLALAALRGLRTKDQERGEAKCLEVALTLTRGIDGKRNMALARGVAGLRVLEELVEEWKRRAESAEDGLRRVYAVVQEYDVDVTGPQA
jgi:hypothetical protein